MKKYLTIAEAAPPRGLTEKAVRQKIFRGQLPYRKLGTVFSGTSWEDG
jgi:hypothetical protein